MGNVTFPISEIFYSLQGEGKLAGVPSVFIRLAGCPVRCPWCDTRRAWKSSPALQMTLSDIFSAIQSVVVGSSCTHAVITGGEPFIHRELGLLARALREQNIHVTIETAGFLYQKVPCDLLSLSPKLPSQVAPRFAFCPSVLKKLVDIVPDYQLKFVVASRKETQTVSQLLCRHQFIRCDLAMVMPNSPTPARYRMLAPKVAQWALCENLRFCPRLHLELNLR